MFVDDIIRPTNRYFKCMLAAVWPIRDNARNPQNHHKRSRRFRIITVALHARARRALFFGEASFARASRFSKSALSARAKEPQWKKSLRDILCVVSDTLRMHKDKLLILMATI